jgi:hypothetical protein
MGMKSSDSSCGSTREETLQEKKDMRILDERLGAPKRIIKGITANPRTARNARKGPRRDGIKICLLDRLQAGTRED